jgi:pimeloyl-ACP methyl ester carboxylesterase
VAEAVDQAVAVVRPRRSVKHRLLRLLRVVLLVYLGLILVIAALQSWIIFPGAATQGKPESRVTATSGTELVELKSANGERIVALFGAALTAEGRPRDDAKQCPTLIYFYGNGMCLADCNSEFDHFRRLGLNVLIPEFVGYGMSEGKPGETGVYATAEAAWEHVSARSDIDTRKILVGGWSLGAAAAIELASKKPVAGLMIFSAFTSMKEMARRVLPWAPTSLILKHHFENEKKIKGIRVPTLIVHGTKDSLVPFDMSQRLAATAPSAKMFAVTGGEHNTLFDDGGEALWGEVEQFVARYR